VLAPHVRKQLNTRCLAKKALRFGFMPPARNYKRAGFAGEEKPRAALVTRRFVEKHWKRPREKKSFRATPSLYKGVFLLWDDTVAAGHPQPQCDHTAMKG